MDHSHIQSVSNVCSHLARGKALSNHPLELTTRLWGLCPWFIATGVCHCVVDRLGKPVGCGGTLDRASSDTMAFV